MDHDPESMYLNLQNVYSHKEDVFVHVPDFDIVPHDFDFSFGSTHYKDFLSVKNIFIDTHYEDFGSVSGFNVNNKLVTHKYYNRASMNDFLKNNLTNDMHNNIIYNAVQYSKLDTNNFISIKDIQHIINKIYIRYLYIYDNNIMPPGKVREFNSVKGRNNNYKNRMILVLENFSETTYMDWDVNNLKNIIFLDSKMKPKTLTPIIQVAKDLNLFINQ
jgi:hypothetical protein